MAIFDREKLKLPEEPKFAVSGYRTFWFEDRTTLAEDKKLFDENEFQIPTKI